MIYIYIYITTIYRLITIHLLFKKNFISPPRRLVRFRFLVLLLGGIRIAGAVHVLARGEAWRRCMVS